MKVHREEPRETIDISPEEIKDAFREIAELRGILLGINFDHEISEIEYTVLSDWIDNNKNMSNVPLLAVIGILRGILADKYINDEEYAYIMHVCDIFADSSTYRQQTIAEQQLKGIIKGISADGLLTAEEASGLREWIYENENILDGPLADAILAICNRVLDNGRMDQNDEDELDKLLSQLVNPIEETAPEIPIRSKKFCLSGNFDHGTKQYVELMIVDNGGEITKNVTKSCDYVVVGGSGSADYAFGNYGTKVKKALVLQQQGQDIKVISETSLFANLEL